MIGLVLVTHGGLAREFIAATEHVVGAQTNISAVCIEPEDDMDQRRKDILAAVAEVNDGAGVIVLTDMFGGTPSNLAISIMDKADVEVIAGVNLPMLIKLASIRGDGALADAVASARPQIYQCRQCAACRGGLMPPGGEAMVEEAALRRTLVIANPRGLHARAAAKFVKTAGAFDAEISVRKDDIEVSGLSIMGLMMLAAGQGCEIELIASGRQAVEAIEAITVMVVGKFDET